MDPWRYSTEGISVALRVTPRSGRDDIDGVETLANGRTVVKVRVRAIAEGGEANRAVTELLAKALGVSKGKVRILSGTTSRLKQVAVDGDPATLGDALRKATAGDAGCWAGGLAALAPCTPLGCIILTKSVHASLEGMNAIVIGRSNLVGRPLVQLLLNENATVTIAHSRSRDLARLCARADLVYAAVGKPEMVRRDWIKPGATVIDVGINRLQDKDGNTRLVGDVAFAEVSDVADAITPVPGGVGQMTVACLLVNTLRAACAIHGLPKPGGWGREFP